MKWTSWGLCLDGEPAVILATELLQKQKNCKHHTNEEDLCGSAGRMQHTVANQIAEKGGLEEHVEQEDVADAIATARFSKSV